MEKGRSREAGTKGGGKERRKNEDDVRITPSTGKSVMSYIVSPQKRC